MLEAAALEAPEEEAAAEAAEGVPELELRVPAAPEERAVPEELAAASYILKPLLSVIVGQ